MSVIILSVIGAVYYRIDSAIDAIRDTRIAKHHSDSTTKLNGARIAVNRTAIDANHAALKKAIAQLCDAGSATQARLDKLEGQS